MRTPLAALLLGVAAASQAGTMLGIDNSRIYKIDSTTGVSTSVGSLTGFGTGDTNALAYNAATNQAYFQRSGKLWSMDVATGSVAGLNIVIGDTAAATFYGNAYYFMGQGDGKLNKIDFAGLTPGATTLVHDFTNNWGFGDIAVNAAGKMYGSSGNSIFSIDLTAPTLSVVSESTHGVQTQIGFIGSTLYGISTGNAGGGTGQLYTYNGSAAGMVGTGVLAKYNGAALSIRDAATYNAAPVPEPASMAALALGAAGMLRRRKAAKR